MFKKISLLSIVISCMSFASFAQKDEGFQLGLKGGVNVVKISGKSFKEEFKYGFHLGGYAEIGLSPKVSIQPEILFNQVNTDTANNVNEIYQDVFKNNITLSYLSIPLLINYKPSHLISLQAGPQYGILINKKKTGIENGVDAFKSGDLSLLGGVQLNLIKFRVYARYAVGLTNLNDIDNKDKWTSQTIQAGVGINL